MDNPRTASPTSRPDLLDPATLSQLGGIEFIAREVVEGFLMGLHRSPHRGFSAEFAELRAYQAGDDLRYIDWRMYGRSDRFYVKQFEQETNLRSRCPVSIAQGCALHGKQRSWAHETPRAVTGRLIMAGYKLFELQLHATAGALTRFDHFVSVGS